MYKKLFVEVGIKLPNQLFVNPHTLMSFPGGEHAGKFTPAKYSSNIRKHVGG